jgi:hypothetical protein
MLKLPEVNNENIVNKRKHLTGNII